MLTDNLIFRISVFIYFDIGYKKQTPDVYWVKHVDLKLPWVDLSIVRLTYVCITQANVTMLQMCLLQCVWALVWYGLPSLTAQLHPISTWQVRNFIVFSDFVGSLVYRFIRTLTDGVTSVILISNKAFHHK